LEDVVCYVRETISWQCWWSWSGFH